jgi:hypothetical protein
MKKRSIFLTLALCLIFATTAFAGELIKRSKGQTVHVTASNIDLSLSIPPALPVDQWAGSRLIIHNRDPEKSIKIVSIKYYNPDGELVTDFVNNLTTDEIGPFASISVGIGIERYDNNQGRPCVIVKWEAKTLVNPPCITGSTAIVTMVDGVIRFHALISVEGTVIKEKRR